RRADLEASMRYALLLALVACRASGDAIVVGEFASLSGSEATFGQSTHQGVALAVKEINAAGGVKGRRIELRTLDDAGQVQEAGTVVTRLVTSEKAVAIIG